MMRWTCLVLGAAAGCGRLGFGTSSAIDASSGDDGATQRVDICNRVSIFDLGPSLGASEVVTDVRVTAVPLGRFGVAFGTSAKNIYTLHLDASLVPEATPHLSIANATTLYSMTSTSSDTFLWVDNAGNGTLEKLAGNWNSATVIDMAGSYRADPALADWGTVVDQEWLLGAIDATGKLALVGFLPDGSGPGLLGGVNYHPAATSASVAARPDSLLNGVVVALGGACQTFVVDAVGNTSAMHTFASSCSSPVLSVVAADPGIVAYEDAGKVFVHRIPMDASQPGTTEMLGPGTGPRLVRDGTRTWAVWRTSDGKLSIGDLDPNLRSTQVTVDAQAIDAISVADRPHLMWISGTELWDGQPCVP